MIDDFLSFLQAQKTNEKQMKNEIIKKLFDAYF
jgi:hypothetical protein